MLHLKPFGAAFTVFQVLSKEILGAFPGCILADTVVCAPSKRWSSCRYKPYLTRRFFALVGDQNYYLTRRFFATFLQIFGKSAKIAQILTLRKKSRCSTRDAKCEWSKSLPYAGFFMLRTTLWIWSKSLPYAAFFAQNTLTLQMIRISTLRELSHEFTRAAACWASWREVVNFWKVGENLPYS